MKSLPSCCAGVDVAHMGQGGRSLALCAPPCRETPANGASDARTGTISPFAQAAPSTIAWFGCAQ
nr:hypothetical protein [Eisenbergiella tayi]